MKKRKRDGHETVPRDRYTKILKATEPEASVDEATRNPSGNTAIQIVIGSYDKVLHGFIATVPAALLKEESSSSQVTFKDNFLFNAHGSAVRCLAISPASAPDDKPQSEKLILASGGNDERINLYQISSSLPDALVQKPPPPASFPQGTKLERPQNKELGSLLHHASSVTVLSFPSRSKLLSGADDNTIAISRTRDWTALSTIRIPVPKVAGRPSGDTAPPGAAPSGVNDFAVHPSQKLMISVGKGEKCMRLWNLVTGKKAAVLNFEKELLQRVGEGKWSRGEGRKVQWNSEGSEFAVAFEKGVVLFGLNCEPKGLIVPEPSTKLHQIHFIRCSTNKDDYIELLAVSTEDGRVLFYSTVGEDSALHASASEKASVPSRCQSVCVLGEDKPMLGRRIKDFECLQADSKPAGGPSRFFILARSDGAVQLWHVMDAELLLTHDLKKFRTAEVNGRNTHEAAVNGSAQQQDVETLSPLRVGKMLGVYETNSRITCAKAVVLRQSASSLEEWPNVDDDEFQGFESPGE